MRLAAHLGMTLGEMDTRMSSAELSEWLAFDDAYGLPDAYFLVARLCTTIMGGRAQDYVPYFAPPPRNQTVADHKAMFSGFAPPPRI